MSKQGTVVEQKQLFLQTRKQLLSRGIAPSERLRTIANEGGIELSVLKGVLDKVNRDLKQHSRIVYSRQMLEHVVSQIDDLYWDSGALQHLEEEDGDAGTDADDDGHTVYQTDDLTQDECIARLPTVFPQSSNPHHDDDNTDVEISRDDYTTALSRLQALSARRQTLQNSLNTSRMLLELLEPYKTPKESVQPNLVWKDAPLGAELGKTRSLAIRVAGRVAERFGDVQVPATAEEDGDGDVDMRGFGGRDEGRRKVDEVLSGW
ncbi:hypothetical protein P153DRAFT_296579 [Dothidotthia symphoricarpi CBS 119687]|uniref:Kinetochore protein fta4 n=1 Tax=Dothidotthia symphoricarpi CBS 119687 TaxID=1392245 RepID=A0A6A6A492_9PLEO|nr:uncharacterized protein P153DRAFT_296579 [Dothidotthia symphoricarpi CBS 119687]KAF2126822.1 hypothetical protein P153DRAFT_296579 [Dothidotthia symphoricarpi CBS 119687]